MWFFSSALEVCLFGAVSKFSSPASFFERSHFWGVWGTHRQVKLLRRSSVEPASFSQRLAHFFRQENEKNRLIEEKRVKMPHKLWKQMSACCGCACNHLAEDSPFVQMDKKYRVNTLSPFLLIIPMDFPFCPFKSFLPTTKVFWTPIIT